MRDKFHSKLWRLEKKTERETGIRGVEFFWCDNEIVGIGTYDRVMPLIHDTELDAGKLLRGKIK